MRSNGRAGAGSTTGPRVGTAPAGLPRVLPLGGDVSLPAHLGRWGPMTCPPGQLIDQVERSGLRGKGGAGFPTAVKLRAVAGRRQPLVVANGTEGEPASAKDRALMTSAPHLVLDGAVAAATAVGATEVVVCVERSATPALTALRRALDERARRRADPATIRLAPTPAGYLTGEESALVHWLGDGDARPTFSELRPAQRGVDRRPTLVQNVETLAHLALIARFGADWFRQVGLAADPGSTLMTVSGGVQGPGVYEVPFGTPVDRLVSSAGGDLSRSSAVLVGGYFGSWITAREAAGTELSTAGLGRLGASLGCGALAVVPDGACGLSELAAVTRWMAGQSAGQCGPCVNGLPAIAGAVEDLEAGRASGVTRRKLDRWLTLVDGRGACRHPDGTVRFVRSGLDVLAGEIARHAEHGPCGPGRALLPTPGTARR